MDPKGTHRPGDGPGDMDGPKGHTQSREWTQRAHTEPGMDPQTHTEPGMDPKGTHRAGDGPKGHTQSRGRTRRHTQSRGRSGGRGRPRGRSSAAAAAPRRAVRGTAAQRPPRPHSAPNPSHRPAPLRGSEPPAAPGGSVFRSGAAARGAVGDRTALLRRSRRAAADAASERPPLPALAVGAAARRGAVGVPRGVLAAEALPAHRARVVLRAERGLSGRPGGTGGGTGWGTGGRRGRRLPAPARARCSRRGRSGCTAAAAPARPPRSPPYTPGTPTPCLQRGAARSDADPPSPPLHPGVAALAEAAPLPGGGREPSERTGGPHSPPPSPPQPPERGHPPTWS